MERSQGRASGRAVREPNARDGAGEPHVDRFYLFDNSVDQQAPRRILRAADGVLLREYEAPPHEVAQLLRSALRQRP